ncbi:MAG: leucyl/phenylalanyl-tRNA--protein transferase [Thermodesulfobacteriota bacterium]
MQIFQLHENPAFPHPEAAEKDGLLAMGGDLHPQRLLKAYAWTIFPWYSQETPVLWWSPDPRLVLFCETLHIPKSLCRELNRGQVSVTVDRAFAEVIRGCARATRPEGEGTWLTPEMIMAYTRLHDLGYAHSVEAWQGGRVVGGIYGVALGRVFFGESMFYTLPNASKIALVALIHVLRQRGFVCLDCQQTTQHMLRFGGREVSRRCLLSLVQNSLAETGLVAGSWDGGEDLVWDSDTRRFCAQPPRASSQGTGRRCV